MKTVGKFTMFKALRPHFKRFDKIAFLYSDSPEDDSVFANIKAGVCWLVIVIYNLQLVIMTIMSRHSTDDMVNISFLALTTLTALVKQIAFTVKIKRIKRLFDITDGELFSPKHQVHVDRLDRNEKSMAKLYTIYIIMVFMGCISQYEYPLVNRMLGLEVDKIPVYFPFNTNHSPIYELVSTYLCILLTFQGYVNVIVDCTIVTFYAQCTVQLNLLRYNLEHLVDDDEYGGENVSQETNQFHYKDSDKIQKRLIQCVKHYQLIRWYALETQSITGEFMIMQIAVTAWSICMTIYKIVGINILSAEFATMMVYLTCMLTQLFLYCYHGSQVSSESEFVSSAVYSGDWLMLSPAFRRKLLIFMACCSKPIVVCAAKVVPIKLESYIAVLRASYTLFTLLNKKDDIVS